MANWCYNNISFNGRCKAFVKRLKSHDYNDCGFEIIKNGSSRCIFSLDEQDDNQFSFESKWAPPIEELVWQANKSKFSFSLDYEELAMGIYGRATYDCNTKELIDIYLPQEVFERIVSEDIGYMIDGILQEEEYTFLENELEKLINKNTWEK